MWSYFCRSQNLDFLLQFIFATEKMLFVKTVFLRIEKNKHKKIKRQFAWIYGNLIYRKINLGNLFHLRKKREKSPGSKSQVAVENQVAVKIS